jgi:hypothetical protein
MRVAAFVPLVCAGLVAVSQSAIGMETVTTCALGIGRSHTLSLLRDHRVASTAVYYLRKAGSAPARLYPGGEDQSRGNAVQLACVGTNEHVFVLSGEFTSNYIQGVAIRYNTKARRWERVDFAEREHPTAIYLDPKGLAVLIPNNGRNESPAKYIIYRYNANTGQAEQTYSDHLPQSRAVRIPPPK